MNKKQFLILAVLVIAIGGASLLMLQKQTAAWNQTGQRLGEKLLGTFDLNAVTQISIRQGTNDLNLVRKGDQWTVRERSGYPASFSDISDLVRKLADLKVTQTEQVGPSLRPRLELIEPGKGTNSGTLVELKADDKVLKTLLLGKKHMRSGGQASPMGDEGFPDGRYVLIGNSDSVALVSDPLSAVEPNPATFLVKDFFKIEKARAISYQSQIATNSWKLTRETETNDWKLADIKAGEELDANKVSGIANALISPGFVDVVPGAKADQTGLDKPTVIVLETFDNQTYTLNVGGKSGEDNHFFTVAVKGELPANRAAGKDEKPEDKAKLDKEFADARTKLEEKLKAEQKLSAWTYLVAKWTVDPILRDRHQLFVDKKEDKPAAAGQPFPGGLPGGLPGGFPQ
ncbi:MAG: DUF4340 domain-containing protein [Opitutaceae bacterium]|nr:DUF4340 domain-containing protein [Verrucomicrobiales bacterium]